MSTALPTIPWEWQPGNKNAQHVSAGKVCLPSLWRGGWRLWWWRRWGTGELRLSNQREIKTAAWSADQSVNEDLRDSAASCWADIQAVEVKTRASGEDRRTFRYCKCFPATLQNIGWCWGDGDYSILVLYFSHEGFRFDTAAVLSLNQTCAPSCLRSLYRKMIWSPNNGWNINFCEYTGLASVPAMELTFK